MGMRENTQDTREYFVDKTPFERDSVVHRSSKNWGSSFLFAVSF